MSSATSLLFLGAVTVAAVGGAGVWFALKRPALERRRRDDALAAAQNYTPAERVPPYGGAPDPCAPGLSDNERVLAMRALLLRGDHNLAATSTSYVDTEPAAMRDDPQTTSPMAWKATLPPDEAEAWEREHAGRNGRVTESDHEHVTL
ncbi:MAG: hypothetical protein IPI03_18330 [Rubrivivax sp.]|jgi:hypothetical protein|nr:hypothetical protein [Rubrivivax sp.]MBK7263704.1 hypothetical protein [Rubrivivax sp.]MBK8526779.1 hypothetical protein [Rubrivivax sp.]